ncbi:MAG: hypothetical protein QY320_08300 [Gammaproteobacteria bacterium]|nr:MAG: hypothetical protein QY320_08300 [Gammaproteobacteria bacterium]
MAAEPIHKHMVCLANSRKTSGRCIAGKELLRGSAGGWLRPVSDREHEEVSEGERQYKDGTDPRVLDIIRVPLIRPRPKEYQKENWLLHPDFYWTRTGLLPWLGLRTFADRPDRLWTNGSSTVQGLNDRVHLNTARRFTESLYLIHAPCVTLRVHSPGEDYGNAKRRVQACFEYAGEEYRLRVTDPVVERRYLAMRNGKYLLHDCYVTVSLGEPYKGYCYKLAAAIIGKDEAERT